MTAGSEAQVWQVLDSLLGEVRVGVYPEGAVLPSEAAVAARYGVSRPTVSRVMWLLRWTGLVVGGSGAPGRIAAEPCRMLALQLVERAFEIRRLNGDVELRGADPGLDRDCLP